MKAAIVLEVVRRPYGSLGAAEEQEARKALVRRRLSDADDPKLFKRCRDQIERAHDVYLSRNPDAPVLQERRIVMTWLFDAMPFNSRSPMTSGVNCKLL